MKLTAPWVRDRAGQRRQQQAAGGGSGGGGQHNNSGQGSGSGVPDIELCDFYEGLEAAGPEGRLEAGGGLNEGVGRGERNGAVVADGGW